MFQIDKIGIDLGFYVVHKWMCWTWKNLWSILASNKNDLLYMYLMYIQHFYQECEPQIVVYQVFAVPCSYFCLDVNYALEWKDLSKVTQSIRLCTSFMWIESVHASSFHCCTFSLDRCVWWRRWFPWPIRVHHVRSVWCKCLQVVSPAHNSEKLLVVNWQLPWTECTTSILCECHWKTELCVQVPNKCVPWWLINHLQ